jgi:protease-4
MSLDAAAIVDRRRMRRKLTFWRVTAVVVALVAIGGGALLFVPGSRLMPPGAYISRIKIQGLIRGNQDRIEALERLGRSRASAVIVHIDSPGGTTAGSEQLYGALRELQSKKPMVVVVDGLAASGAYIAALSADHIIANETSLVGSIGVLFQYPNFTDVLKTIGIKVEEVKSSPLKAAPNGFEPTSPEARAAIEAIVLDSYAWFKDLVKNRRKMDNGQLTRVADGRVFTGRQAVGLKLVDGLGNEKTALAWLEKGKKGAHKYAGSGIFAASALAANFPSCTSRLGRSKLWGSRHCAPHRRMGRGAGSRRLNLDGLLALAPPSTN